MKKEVDKPSPKLQSIPSDAAKSIGVALILYGAISVIQDCLYFYAFQIVLGPGRLTFVDLCAQIVPLISDSVTAAFGVVIIRRPKRAVRIGLLLCCLMILCAAVPLLSISCTSFPMPKSYFLGQIFYHIRLPIAFTAGWLILRRTARRRATCEGAPVCEHCGYVMRGLNEPRCPECGRVYTLDEFYAL